MVVLQQGVDFGPGKGEPLPLFDGSRMVAYTNDMERLILEHTQG